MPNAPVRDPRVDAYIDEAPDFAKPILVEIRARVFRAHPAAEETIKWGVPFYTHGGKLLANMAAFKKHVKAGVWTGMKPAMTDATTVAELLPAKEHIAQIEAALALIEGKGAGAVGQTTKPAAHPTTKAAKQASVEGVAKSTAKPATTAKTTAKPSTKVKNEPPAKATKKVK